MPQVLSGRRLRTALLAASLAWFAVHSPGAAIPATPRRMPSVIHVAVQKTLEPDFFSESYEPTMRYLEKTFPDVQFVRTDYSIRELTDAVRAGEVDVFFADSGFFTFLHIREHIMQVATRQAPFVDNPGLAQGMAVVVRSDGSVKALSDLKGRKVATEDQNRFTTWVAFQGVMSKQGADPEKLSQDAVFTNYAEPGPMRLLEEGKAQAAVLPTCRFERLESEGKIPAGRFRVLEPVRTAGFPCRSTSQLFPDTVFGATPHVSAYTVKMLQVATLTMPPTARGFGWGIANDFHAVDDLYRELRAGPYSYLREANWSVLWERYGKWILVFLALVALLAAHSLRANFLVEKRTRELRQAIDEKDSMERQARAARERLSEMERAGVVSEMSSMLVHELKQPLATLMTYAGGLAMMFSQKGLTGSDEDKAAGNIVEQAQRISGIVDRVRSYAKAGSHPRQRIAVYELIERSIRTFRHSMTSDGVSVVRLDPQKWSGGGPEVIAEPLEMELAVVNLLKNSATSMAGMPPRQRRIEVGCSEEGGLARIVITDYGPPVSDEVFDSLARPTHSLKRDGLGLGLMIVKRILESHGGSLAFERNPGGRGLTARLAVPLAGTTGQEAKDAQSDRAAR